jgi:hypothetical protein
MERMSTTDDLTELMSDLDQINMNEWLNKFISPHERTGNIYHYTNAQGLLGILQSGNLWATHFLGMNDVSEVHYARELALDAIDSLSIEFCDGTRQFLSQVAALIDAVDEMAAPYVM